MQRKATSINLSDKEMRKLKKLKEAYECDSNSEIIRLLVNDEFNRMQKYHEMKTE